MTVSSNRDYFAAVPTSEIADEILDKVDGYFKYLSLSGRLNLYRRSWTYYYRPRITGAQLNPTGQQGELTQFSVNHYRNLLVHLETMTCQTRPSWDPRAINTDVKSQSQCILASGLLEYYMREKKLERQIKAAVKESLIFGEAFVKAEWDPTSGNVYGKTSTGATIYEGDIKYTNYMPLDVVRDFTKTSSGQDDWHILRDFQNKFTLAAKYPDLADDILSDAADMLEIARTTTINALQVEDSDNIPVYTLIHRPTPALPQGRYTQVLDNGTVLLDGPIPYKETHVYRIAPDEESGTIFGFTVGYDLLSVQESIDVLYSTVISNQATFGVQNILVPKGHDLSTSQLSGGANVLEYDPNIGKPEALNLTETPPEIFNFMQELEHVMETLSGVNSVTRGNPEASLKSGSALALVASMAISFSMNLQQSYAQLIEDLGTGTINILKDFASVPRVAAIAGKANRPLMKSFTGADLNAINRVIVDMGNPLTRTTAGRVNLAESLMTNKLIDNADQYIQVLTTGRLEPVIEGKQAQLLLIKGENEKLAEGIPQRALKTDNHAKHILEHQIVLASPEARQDPNSPVIQAALEHIQEHINLMNDPANQQLMAILHEEVVPGPVNQPPSAMNMPVGNAISNQNPILQQVDKVNMPNMPKAPPGSPIQNANIISNLPSPV